MNTAINKDMVILALKGENEKLREVVAALNKKSGMLQEYTKAKEEMEALYQKKEDNTNKIIRNYELIIEAMKKQLQKEMDTNQELNAKIEEISALLESKISQK